MDCQCTGAALINVIKTRSPPVMWSDMNPWVEGGLYSPHRFKYAQSGLLTHSPTVNNYTLSVKRVTLELNLYFSCHNCCLPSSKVSTKFEITMFCKDICIPIVYYTKKLI